LLGGANDAAPLGDADGLERPAEVARAARPRAHLHEAEHARRILGDDVELTQFAAVVGLENAIAVRREIVAGDTLGVAADDDGGRVRLGARETRPRPLGLRAQVILSGCSPPAAAPLSPLMRAALPCSSRR